MEHKEIAELTENPLNPRGVVVHDAALRELAMSIQSQGVLQPILITPNGTIVAGHRRVAACKLINQRTVPVIVREFSEAEQLQVMLIENMQRASLDVVQEGKACLKLMDYGLTLSQVSKTIGLCRETLKVRMAVAQLPEECHSAFATGQLALIAVNGLTPLPKDKQIYWVERAVKEQWAGNQLCRMISRSRSGAVCDSVPTPEEIKRAKLGSCLERIEVVDKELDGYELRNVQTLLRQASSLILETMMKRKGQQNGRNE